MEDNNNLGTDLEVGATSNDQVADQTTSAPAAESNETPKNESVRDAVMRAFEKTSKKGEAEPKTAMPKLAGTPEATTERPAIDTTKAVDPVTGRELEAIKPPSSMTPALREKWGSLDRQMQQFWVDREKDMSSKLNETAEERKLASQFREVAAPYEAMLRQFGTNATDHAKELFNLSHTLNTGSPQTKAQVIGQLIQHFRPDADTLRQVLSGVPIQPTAPAPTPVDVQSEVERALAQREQAALEREAQLGIDAFENDPKNEFLKAVAPLMKKAIDAGFITGNSMQEVLKNAYDFACQQDPEVRGVLAQRAAGQPTSKPVGSTKPSLGTGRSNGQKTEYKTTRAAVLAAYEKHSKQ